MQTRARNLIAAAVAVVISLLGAAPVAGHGVHHAVVSGDTLSHIAALYNVTVAELVGWNGIANPNLIFPGQVIEVVLHDDPAAPTPASSPGVYTVQDGDTLSSIAVRFDTTTEELAQLNGLQDRNFIRVGQQLLVPGAPAEVAPPPPPSPSLPAARPSDPDLEAIIEELSRAWGVNPGLVKALAWVESGWNQSARSPAGAVGVMQIMPGTADWIESDVLGQELNEDLSVYDNVKMGVALLKLYLDATRGDVDLALAAYYQGAGVTLGSPLYQETLNYIWTVKAVRDRFWP